MRLGVFKPLIVSDPALVQKMLVDETDSFRIIFDTYLDGQNGTADLYFATSDASLTLSLQIASARRQLPSQAAPLPSSG